MPEVKERPILFNGPMVNAVLDGAKTVTRRALSARSLKEIGYGVQLGECHELPADGQVHPNSASYYAELCPFGLPGDRLWVRETFALLGNEDGVCIDWNAEWQAEEHITHCKSRSTDYLTAAMRCLVLAETGETVRVPKELQP